MSEKMEFFIFLIEQYARQKGVTADQVLRQWDEHGVTQTIYDGYWEYHQEALENAYADIDCLLSTGKHAW